MKTIIKYILAVPLMLCFSSCLDEHPKDQLDQEAIYNNADNIYKNAVASLYNYIGSNQESDENSVLSQQRDEYSNEV